MIAALAPGVLEGLEGQGLALADLTVLLVIGGSVGALLGMKRWGLPEALLAGGLGLLVAPAGLLPLLPQRVIDLWDQLPLPLLTLVFATLLLGKPLPKLGGLWRPLSAQVLLALTLAFGQFLVGGLAVLLVLQPWLGVSPVMACLIEVAYEGGHGSAAAMGPTYERLGLEGAQALGLAMATVGPAGVHRGGRSAGGAGPGPGLADVRRGAADRGGDGDRGGGDASAAGGADGSAPGGAHGGGAGPVAPAGRLGREPGPGRGGGADRLRRPGGAALGRRRQRRDRSPW